MRYGDLALVQGLRDTHGALADWRDGRWRVVGSWATWSFAVAVPLLGAVYVVALISVPPLAIAFVVGATAFSLMTQAYALGGYTSTVAAALGISPAVLLLAVIPHALPELTALFLPLAAWTLASRAGEWHKLLAATFVTVAVAVPILILCALWEIFVAPGILVALAAG